LAYFRRDHWQVEKWEGEPMGKTELVKQLRIAGIELRGGAAAEGSSTCCASIIFAPLVRLGKGGNWGHFINANFYVAVRKPKAMQDTFLLPEGRIFIILRC
jgi:hypothetical protein